MVVIHAKVFTTSLKCFQVFKQEKHFVQPQLHQSVCASMSQTFVVVDIQVVRSREDGNEGGEACSLTLSVHAVPARRETQDAHVSAIQMRHRTADGN